MRIANETRFFTRSAAKTVDPTKATLMHSDHHPRTDPCGPRGRNPAGDQPHSWKFQEAFALQPVALTKSPLDVPGVRSRLRRGELVELIRSERERAGERIVVTERRESR